MSLDGYTYALDPLTGATLWGNDLPGMGTGVVCLATVHGSTAPFSAADAEARRQQTQASHGSAG